VKYLAPFLKGTTASTAFCVLYKMWTLRLTVNQVSDMVERYGSPYARGLGFLYLRYVLQSKQLWEWFGDFLEDEEEVQVGAPPHSVKWTIGRLCRELLTQQKFCNTMLPRIPVPVAKQLEQDLVTYDREMGHAAPAKADKRGSAVRDRSRSPRRGDRGDTYRGDTYRGDEKREGREWQRRERSPANRDPQHRDRSQSRERRRDAYEVRDRKKDERLDRNRPKRDLYYRY